MKKVVVDKGVAFGGASLTFIAGPCVIESREMAMGIARTLCAISRKLRVPYIFKASFDKANRTSVDSFRGPGIDKGLEILAEIRQTFDVPVLTDVHEPWQCAVAAQVCDVLQIPAFLARQTDLVVAAGETGAVVNVKKGQFMAPEDMVQVARKIESTGNRRIVLCERGSSFGYRNLVADMRSLLIMRETGYPVVMDATHSVQRPGGLGTGSGGDGKYAPALARAAVATGVDGVFMETHPNPPEAKSDAANALKLSCVEKLWKTLVKINDIVKGAKMAFAAACVFSACALRAAETAGADDGARLAAAYSNCVARIDKPARGVTVPVETHPDGAVKIEVSADRAQFFDKEGLVWCGGVTVREYEPDGTVRLELFAEGCVVDRKTRSGWLDGRATGRYGESALAGSGVWFSAPDEAVKIYSGVEIVSKGIKLEGLRL